MYHKVMNCEFELLVLFFVLLVQLKLINVIMAVDSIVLIFYFLGTMKRNPVLLVTFFI